MRKICGDPVRFVVSLKEVMKYGLSQLDQLQRNPEAKLLFPEGVKNNVIKGNSQEK